MRLLLATLLLTLMPGFAAAQEAAAPAPSLAPPLTQWWLPTHNPVTSTDLAMPLWSTPDGRILAIVALGNNGGAPVAPQSPQIGSVADWRLVDVTNFIGAGLSLRLAENANAYAKFGRGIVLAPAYGSNSNCSALNGGCADLIRGDATTGSGAIGAQFSAGNVDLDVNYGLSWLHVSDQTFGAHPAFNPFAGLGETGAPTLLLPGFTLANVQNAGLNAQSRWHVDDTQTIDLGAALSRIQYELPGLPVAPALNQAALSFGLHRGDFSGLIVGRVLGPADPLNGQHWSSIDLGVSWRAPWRGVFSIGAQNVWSSGYLPSLNEPAAAREIDPAQTRVPYVQYHQDL